MSETTVIPAAHPALYVYAKGWGTAHLIIGWEITSGRPPVPLTATGVVVPEAGEVLHYSENSADAQYAAAQSAPTALVIQDGVRAFPKWQG